MYCVLVWFCCFPWSNKYTHSFYVFSLFSSSSCSTCSWKKDSASHRTSPYISTQKPSETETQDVRWKKENEGGVKQMQNENESLLLFQRSKGQNEVRIVYVELCWEGCFFSEEGKRTTGSYLAGRDKKGSLYILSYLYNPNSFKLNTIGYRINSLTDINYNWHAL